MIIYDHGLAQAIVDTIRQPLLVLDEELRVVAASRAFSLTFGVDDDDTIGRLLHELGDGQWNIPALREQLERIAPEHGVLEGYEVELDFPLIGRRSMLLSARKVFYEHGAHTTILLTIEDITDRRAIERERDQLLREKDLLLEEMQHRVANSLQIIASILLMKARSVTSEEMRKHLHDAHDRVLAVAAVQKHLHATIGIENIDLRHYLTQLCESLAGSMIGAGRSIAIRVEVDEARASSSGAVSIGLIVTELVINALKHAFPTETPSSAIMVKYASVPPAWRLSVSDNGIGRLDDGSPLAQKGLGTSIVTALAEQLSATFVMNSSASGTSAAIEHAWANLTPDAPEESSNSTR